MRLALFLLLISLAAPSLAQVPPSTSEIAAYAGLHQAAQTDDAAAIRQLVAAGAALEARDSAGRTAVHVAAFAGATDALRALAEAGADMNALEHQAYDAVTIAAVANDPDTMSAAIALGNDPGLMTSPYDGTALIAAAHLGHVEVVKRLIAAGAPLDHVNNLNWTALIEAVVLGDGGPDHIETVRALVEAGADRSITDRSGRTPLELAEAYGFSEIAGIIRGE
ncbi:MAG: ankyrin repeat domain-containing protein [Rhodobacteraceae bacterium]|nr:ankyrin repeat domain-containing protein [Paracoccaceae bacterium]